MEYLKINTGLVDKNDDTRNFSENKIRNFYGDKKIDRQ